MAIKQKNLPPEDDGRTVADMNIDGMPWYVPKRPGGEDGREPPGLTAAARRAYAGGVLRAALLIAAVYVSVFLLFILFCIHVWFS